MTLGELFGMVRKRWLYVVVPILLAAVAATTVTWITPKTYQAVASVYFSLPLARSANDLNQGANYTQQQLASFASLATKPVVLDPVIDDLALPLTAAQLAGRVSASISAETVIIDVSVTDGDPQQAARISNAIATRLIEVVVDLSPEDASGQPAIAATVVAAAVPSTGPISPRGQVNLAAGLLAGLLIGLMAAIARERLDTRVRTRADIPSDVPLLAQISADRAAKRIIMADPHTGSPRAEAFRRLRTNLSFVDVDDPAQITVITSALASEGKTSTAVNLALAAARAGDRVLLVDADLRRPTVAKVLDLEGGAGLVDVITGGATLSEVVRHWDTNCDILTSGPIPPNPSELLSSKAMTSVLADMRSKYDLVLLDSPPLLPVIDAAVLAQKTDGAVVVSRHNKVKRHELAAAIDSLRAVDSRVLGVVMTFVPERSTPYVYDSHRDPELPVRPATTVSTLTHGEGAGSDGTETEPSAGRRRGAS